MELVQPSKQSGGYELFPILRCKKSEQELFDCLTKDEVSDFLPGWLSSTFVLWETMRFGLI